MPHFVPQDFAAAALPDSIAVANRLQLPAHFSLLLSRNPSDSI
jgi:hypothetical protein